LFDLDTLHGQLRACHQEISILAEATRGPEQSAEDARERLLRLAGAVQALSEQASRERQRGQDDVQRIEEVIEVLYGLAGLDFSRRAKPRGDGGSLDALAAAVNMVSEELEASQQQIAERNLALEALNATFQQEIGERKVIERGLHDAQLLAEEASRSDGSEVFLVINMATSSASTLITSVTLPECQITLREDGIIELSYTMSGELDVDVMQRVAAATKTLTDRPRPVLVHLNKITGLTRRGRIFAAEGEETKLCISRGAFMTNSPLHRILGNFFMGLNKPPVPTQLFSDEVKAVEWLLRDS
jgi:hypothetical protein